MNYQIRKATPSDMRAIIKLCAEHAEFERAEFSPEKKRGN